MANATDLRIVKTLEAIHESFEELASKQALESITVAELCRQARIGKKTFYRHYPALENLVQEYLDVFFESFLSKAEGLNLPENNERFVAELLLHLCDEGNQNPVYECLVCGTDSDIISSTLIARLTELQRINTRKFGRLSAAEISLVLMFSCNTAIALYQQWVKEGKHLSAKRLAELSKSLVSSEASLRK